MAKEQSEKQDRLKKLENLKKQGITPYPATAKKTHNISAVVEDFSKLDNKKLFLCGRVMSKRGHGKLIFSKFKDESGEIQIVFEQNELGKDKYKNLKNIDVADILEIQGNIFTTQKGEKSVLVKDYRLLSKALEPLPDKWHGIKDEETRYRKRYLDILLNPEVKDMFEKKAIFWQSMRDFLLKKDFLHVKTPVLENTPGGADAAAFATHHNALDTDLYLRISMGELWQKRLMVAGYEKTFEIGRQFRNEGIDPEHLQDYTQMEFYMAYANYEDGMKLVEEMFKHVVKQTFGTYKFKINKFNVDLSKKWERIDYVDLIEKEFKINVIEANEKEIEKICAKNKIEIPDGVGKGRLIDNLMKRARKTVTGPAFLINHPVEVSPLAKRKENDPKRVERYQPLIAGSELGNGYTELNDPLDQADRFAEQAKLREAGDEEAQMHDKEFVEALEHGMPPTTGFGVSERLFSFLMDKPIRECALFPLLRPKHKIDTPVTKKNKVKNITKDEIFYVDNAVMSTFSDLKISYSIVKGVEVKREDKKLEEFKKKNISNKEQAKEKLSNLKILEDYRNIFKKTGVDPTSKKPSPIALLDRLSTGKPLYKINTVVDAVNLVVMKYGISMGAFDYDKIKFPSALRFAEAGEEFLPILEKKSKKIKAGELVYADQEKIICRDLNYRDSEYTKITEKTKNVILYIDGASSTSQEEVDQALKEAEELIIKFCGGEKNMNNTDFNIPREESLKLLQEHMKDQANLNHSREAEVIMRALAKHLNEDQELWGALGLLHDVDWEYGVDTHCAKCRDILNEAGYDDFFIETIISHGYGASDCAQGALKNKKRETKIQYALAAAETITGLIYASALVRPDKKLASVKVKSIKKKFKDKSFAAKVDREVIKECENLGLELSEFLEISLQAMQEISDEIGV